MYKNGSKTISLEEAQVAAEFSGMEVQDWANEYGWSEEGKITVPEETTPPTEPEKTETSAGESSSDDSLLGSYGDSEDLAKSILQARAEVKAENIKAQIAAEFFGLEQTPDGSYRVKANTKTLDAVGLEGTIGFRQEGGVDARQFSEQGLLSELGQERYDKFMSLTGGNLVITAEQIEQLNIEDVDPAVVNSVVAQEKQRAGELVAREFGQDKVDALAASIPSEEEIEKSFEQAEQEGLVLEVNRAYLDKELSAFNEKKKSIEAASAEKRALVERRKEIAESITIVPGASAASIEAYENSYKLYNEAVQDYNAFIVSEEVKALGEMAARLNEASELYNERLEANARAVNQTIENAALSSVAVKSYNATDRIMFELEDSILGSATALMGLGADFVNYLVDNEGVSEALDNFKGRTVQYAVDLENRRMKEMPLAISDEDIESGKATYGDQIVDITLNNSATILTVMLPGGAAGMSARVAGGISRKVVTKAAKRELRKRLIQRASALSSGLFFTMEAGGELRRLDSEKREFTKVDPVTGMTELESLTEKLEKEDYSGNQEKRNIESRIELISNALNTTEIERSFSAVTKGAIAMYAERLGTLRTFQNAKKWTQATRAAKFSKYVSAPIARWAANAEGLIRGTAKIAGTELLEEGVTLAAHNLVDITVLGENKSVLDGMDKDFAKNVIIPTLVIAGPNSMGNVGVAIRNEFLTSAQIKRKNAQIEKLFSMQERLTSENMSEYDRQVLESKKMDLLKEMSLEEANALIDASKLDAADIDILADLQGELSKLRSEAEALGMEGASVEDLKDINQEIEEVVRKRDAVLEKSEAEIEERIEKAQDKAKARMLLRSFERFNALAKMSMGDKFVEIQLEEDFNKLPENIREEAKQAMSDGGFGANLGGYSIVFNQNAIAGILTNESAFAAATAAVHEIGHSAIEGAGVLKDKEVAGVARAFINVLKENIEAQVTKKKITQETANTILERFARYEQDTDLTEEVRAEELIMVISEMKALGLVGKNNTEVLSKGKVFVNALLNKVAPKSRMFIPLSNLSDVSAFLDRFQSKLIDGDRIQTAPSEETKESKGLLDEINALVPDTVQTQADFFDRKVFNPIYNDGNLHPAIANYVRSKSVSKEEAQKIIESVADRLINFNPEAARKSGDAKITFGEFLFANVNFSKLDARKALFAESQERAQTESTDSEQAKQITASETTTTVEAEKPKYKSLTQRRVLSEEAMNTVSGKVLSVVRVLKNSIDAEVSKNVTVTPLIAEIKKALGKQLDIDFKKEMGGLKDGELRKYLLRNKAAILENMTTTWLMTAMPNAVQKQVGGVWTSDWKGKKIDREKVTTDNAGRTSGAELVRRLPKASTRLSDAEFLSNFFTEDGKLIRGRKESLAKAMGEEMGIEIIKDALADENSEIAQAFINSQERAGVEDTGNIKVKFDLIADRGNVKFSKGLEKINASFNPNFDLELQGQNQGNALLQLHNLAEMEDLRTEKGQDAYLKSLVEDLFPLMPKAFFFGPQGGSVFTSSSKLMGSTSKSFPKSQRDVMWERFQGKIKELSKLDESNFGEPIPGLDSFQVKSYTTLFKDVPTILKSINNGELTKFNNQVSKIHKAMWQRFAEAVAESKDKNIARTIMKYMHHGVNNMSHPQRMGAQFVGYSEDFVAGSKTGTFEHAMPNISAYTYLMDVALRGDDFQAAYRAVMGNYKLIALSKKSDDKLIGRYKTKMPENWSLLENTWWERYFNPDVFANNGGIDPNSILTIDGRKFGDAAGIKADGSAISAKAAAFNKLVNNEELKKAKEAIQEVDAKKPIKLSKGLSEEFNDIIERKTGVEAFKEFSRIQAQLRGKKVGKFKFFIAPGADDFRGLVHYAFAGKGKQGEKDMAWFEEKLMTPYFKGIAAIDGMRQQIKRDFAVVKKQFSAEYKLLSQNVGDSGFTFDHALRVYMWNRQGTVLEGLSKRDTKLLLDAIEQNPELVSLADALLVVARREEWPDPVDYWEGGSVLADLNSMTEKIGRKKFLEEFIANAEVIFSEANLNKVEALYGRKHRAAIEDSLYAMKNGTNRPSGNNAQINSWLNWLNGSTGAIMFFNRRSALLQMLSFTNFINWSDNNPMKAALAFANQKQYWSDFAMIFNSDKLKERRGGLKQDVSDSELASVAGKSKKSPQAILAYLLKIGFTPTQIADSMAIATGGAMFYRNRVNTYLNDGLSQEEAEELAFLDFSKKSDEAQQSSDPALVSQEQRGVLGRIILAFANTPMQYTRLMKKAAMDLKNGRGNAVEHVSKIAYYGMIQNFVFSALQSAMFALAFDDDEEEELTEAQVERKIAKDEQRVVRVINSMLDTILRGSGIYGAVAAVGKNTIMEYAKQEEKGFLADHAYTLLAAASISPPIQSKLRKLYSAIQTKRFEKDNIEARGWALTADGKMNLGPNYSILGNVLSATTNLPMDRVVDELRSVSEALDARNKAWQRIALALGWKTWDVGARNEEADLIKSEAKTKRREEGVEKAKKTRKATIQKKRATKLDAWNNYIKENNLNDLQAANEYAAWQRKWNAENK